MYTQEQRRAHVRGLQQDLRVVQAALGEPLPKVSGVYDDATEHAVQRFQRHFGLPVTGKADLSTSRTQPHRNPARSARIPQCSANCRARGSWKISIYSAGNVKRSFCTVSSFASHPLYRNL